MHRLGQLTAVSHRLELLLDAPKMLEHLILDLGRQAEHAMFPFFSRYQQAKLKFVDLPLRLSGIAV